MKKNNTYAVFEYDNFSEAGLKKFVALLARQGADVASVTGTNRPTKKDGIMTKRTAMFFTNQQKAEIVIGDAGDIVSLKINGKMQPVGLPKNLADFAKQISVLLDKGQAAFDKALKRRTDKIKVDKPKTKVAARTNKARITEAEAQLAEAKISLSELRVKENGINEAVNDASVTLKKANDEYEAAVTLNKALRAELNQLKKAV